MAVCLRPIVSVQRSVCQILWLLLRVLMFYWMKIEKQWKFYAENGILTDSAEKQRGEITSFSLSIFSHKTKIFYENTNPRNSGVVMWLLFATLYLSTSRFYSVSSRRYEMIAVASAKSVPKYVYHYISTSRFEYQYVIHVPTTSEDSHQVTIGKLKQPFLKISVVRGKQARKKVCMHICSELYFATQPKERIVDAIS